MDTKDKNTTSDWFHKIRMDSLEAFLKDTVDDVSKKHNITRERVRQTAYKAARKILGHAEFPCDYVWLLIINNKIDGIYADSNTAKKRLKSLMEVEEEDKPITSFKLVCKRLKRSDSSYE